MKKMYTAQEMREMALIEESYRWDVVAKMLRQAADMMEREAAREKSSQVGNAAKMREALEALVGVIDNYDYKNPLWWHSGAKGVKPLKDARAAIAEPSRGRDDLEVCSDYDESDESRNEEREAYKVDKADAKRKGEW